MSGTNKNCHVSTKWLDSGGKPNPECDTTLSLNPITINDISLQELIDEELALRSNTVSPTTSTDRPKSLLLCDSDDLLLDAIDKSDPFVPRQSSEVVGNGGVPCQRSNSIKSNKSVIVTEVEDFDQLYNEVSSNEIITNGYTITPLLSPELSVSSQLDSDVVDEITTETKGDTDAATPLLLDLNTSAAIEQSVEDESHSSSSNAVTDIIDLLGDPHEQDQNTINKNDNFCRNDDIVTAGTMYFGSSCVDNIITNSTATNDFLPMCGKVDIVADGEEIRNVCLNVSNSLQYQSPVINKHDEDKGCIDEATSPKQIIAENTEVESGTLIFETDSTAKPIQESNNHIEKEQKVHVEIDAPLEVESVETVCNNGSIKNDHNDSHMIESVNELSYQGKGDASDETFMTVQSPGSKMAARDVLILDKNGNDEDYFGYSGGENEKFEEGFENWTTQTTKTEIVTANKSATSFENTEFLLTQASSCNLTSSFEIVSESNSVEKKTVKKKKSTSDESVTTTKTKKTKKTRKCEEKENISVSIELSQNGMNDPNFHQIVDDGDELSNVCVRDLKIMYCNEVSKTTNGDKLSQYEEPIPASVPIKELAVKYEALKHNNSAVNFKDERSGFGKFDQLTKKTVMHVRSSDPAKAQQQFSQNDTTQDSGNLCKACNRNVFAMEQIKAERHLWHKNCFRCKTCNKQLTVDVYSSHEGELYCKPHFRDLFKPKTVVEEEKPLKFRKPELIIRENEPVELPPDVVRASDKPDLGLEELSSLNVKSRFQVFEKPQVEDNADKSPICVKRSPSILSKLAKFQAKGMDVGVSSDIFNGIDYEESSSSEEEPAQNDNVTRSSVIKEKPIAFNKMNDVKMNWENGQAALKEERREQRREEMQNIRSRLFMGKQNKMREAYENAVAESERGNVKKDVEVKSEKARTIKEKFEKGEVLHDEETEEEQKKSNPKNEDMEVFEAGISKKSRSIFQQMDAAVVKTQSTTNVTSPPHIVQNGHKSHKEVVKRQVSTDVVRASDPVEEIAVQTADISSKFKFFETYKAPEVKRKTFRITPPREGQLKTESPEREVHENPSVDRNDKQVEDENEILKKSNTTAKMLSLFRQLEETRETVPDGPKPMKKFTPPPMSSSSSETESEEESEEQSEASNPGDDIVRASDKKEDEYLKLAQKAAKAKALKEKFEKWEPEKQSNNNAISQLDSEHVSLDTTKSLRARFESLKAEQPSEKPRLRVNRFVDKSLPGYCDTCFKKVYPLEKVEAGDKVFHRSCFKCTRCSGILRMETFTMNNGHLYCVPHFKQLFITKGNYDEGFGNHQHKAKWPVHTGVPMANGLH